MELSRNELRIRALEAALRYWDLSMYQGNLGRRNLAISLSEFNVFGPAHIAAVTRLSRTTVWRMKIADTVPGGRFNPNSLSLLLKLAEAWHADHEYSKPLVSMALADGCSAYVVSNLTGIPLTHVYKIKLEDEK